MTTVRLDLNNPTFQSQLFDLEKTDRQQVMTSLTMVFAMTWEQIYRDKGLHWERILSKRGPQGEPCTRCDWAADFVPSLIESLNGFFY